ncbi:hypothetical protein VPNG_08762 [Cytospora leucostoma]|uniref:Uncharacterized protein n=1 Tax=Cytospora leucostoma TaxID=1230097 RepID=A0A423VXP0_9PEZI|nr:hypothetical protein VPNG_08762 [Cytospora leucostoma]
MGQERIELTHDDIWDDSALVDSWNEALDEYKKYHSIHASGGKLEDLPEFQQDNDAEPDAALPPAAPTSGSECDIKGETTSVVGTEDADHAAKNTIHPAVADGDKIADVHQGLNGGGAMPPPPQALLGSMQDEGLKRLLMSWYYAGYYTGLYEGKQQQQQQQS